jgi:hypothetical protein
MVIFRRSIDSLVNHSFVNHSFVNHSFVNHSFVKRARQTPDYMTKGNRHGQAQAGTGTGTKQARGQGMFNIPQHFFGLRRPCVAKFDPSQAETDSHDASFD